MKAILEITSERMHGHNRALRIGQSVEVGRSPLIDFPVEHDAKMSDRHFLVHTDQRACYLEDLGSQSGTLVNGNPISKPVVLHDEDEIVAGATHFKIHLQGIDESVVYAPEHVAPAGSTPIRVAVDHEVTPSEMQLYRGKVAELSPAELIARMQQTLNCFHIIDPAKLGCPLPEEVPSDQRLFDWFTYEEEAPEPDEGSLPDDSAADQNEEDGPEVAPLRVIPENTPLIASVASPQLAEFLEQHWGKDALVTVFWDQNDDPPLEQVRHCAGVFVAPSIMRPQLNQTAFVAVKDLMMGIDRVLVQDDAPESWLIYAIRDLDDELRRIGLTVHAVESETEIKVEEAP